MADLAIGISKTVVEALAKKVNAAIKGEAELWQIVQRDTVFMKDEFEIMQAFLKTVDWEQSNNNVVKTWVRQIRHLYSDAEDTIESILLLDTKRSFWTMLHHLVASSNCISGAAPSPLEQAVAKIQVFKARVEEISNRSVRYNLINDSRFMPIPSEQLVLGHAIGTTAAVDIRSEAWSTTHKQGGFVDLTMLVNESSDDLRIISLWGTQGDFGVTSIIKEAYEREEIRQKFRNRAWLKLSHPFNSQEFIQRLAEQFYCKDEGEIITVVAKRVKEQRYLVILEGLSSMSEWQAVRTWLPADSKNGSRIVVSTNQLEIARLCAGKSYQVSELRKLPNSHSIFAFFCECYLYGSVFSEMKNIPRSHFMRRWIAEGYIQSADGNTMEEDAAELFSRFVKQTELLGGWGGNSFFHEYINSRLMEDKLIFRPHVSVLSKMGQSLTVEGRGQHLAIRSCWVRFESAFNNLDLTELQSLTVSGQWMAFFMPCQMKWLRVLDLEGAACVDDEELKRILELVPRLRFLSLRGHKGITHLPDSLYRLVYLQTLDIRDTSVVYVELHKLRNLQWFRAGTGVSRTGIHPGLGPEEHSMPSVSSSRSRAARLLGVGGTIRPCYGVKVPRGIRHLKALDTLGVINVNTTDGTGILDELRLLKHLKKLQVSGINRKNSKFLSRTIINQKNLESLSLQFEEEDRAVREGDISPPPSIRSLKLYGHVEKLSALRFNNLRNIRKLSLQMTNLLRQQDVDLIGRVRSLITLSLLIDSSQDGQLQFPPHLFCKLKVLEIVCMSKLRVIFDQGAMEKLEVLKAHCCSDSSLKVTGLEHPVSLKQVCLQGSYGHTLKEALQEQLASHPKKPALNLQMNEDWD
nr:unnamed protein product [Digitaria exilis]